MEVQRDWMTRGTALFAMALCFAAMASKMETHGTWYWATVVVAASFLLEAVYCHWFKDTSGVKWK